MSRPTWDEAKHARNLARGRMGFDEAASVLEDPRRVEWPDRDHSGEEDRFVTVGISIRGRFGRVVTAYTKRVISVSYPLGARRGAKEMRTQRASRSTDPMDRLKATLRRPHTWHIGGIDAFWIEDASGRVLSDEFPEPGPAYEAALGFMASAKDIEDIVLVGRRSRRGRTALTHGLVLLDLAEGHAGLPARRRTARE